MIRKTARARNKTTDFGTGSDNRLLIWAAAAAAGLLIFFILVRGFHIMETTLVFSQWWEDELESDVLEKIAADFEAKNPGIRIVLDRKSRPEIAAFLEGSAASVKGKKKNGTADIVSLEGGRIAGGRAFPVISFINPLFYNISLLESSGYDRPPKNQTEFLSYVQTITKSEQGVYGAALALGRNDAHTVGRYILSWIWAAGVHAEENFTFNSKPVLETLSFLNQLKPFLFPGPFAMNEEAKLAAFAEGKAGMMVGSISDIKKIRKHMEDDFGVTTIPAPVSYAGKPVFFLSTWYIGINTAGGKQKEAEAFAEFLVENASRLDAGAFAVPGGGTRDAGLIKSDPYYSKAYEMYDAGEIVQVYETEQYHTLNAIIYEEVKRMFDGQSPENTAAAIQSRWDKQ